MKNSKGSSFTKKVEFMVQVLDSCKTIQQFNSWMNWIRSVKLTKDDFSLLVGAGNYFFKRKWPTEETTENVKL